MVEKTAAFKPDESIQTLQKEKGDSYGKRNRVGLIAGPLVLVILLLLPAPEGLSDAGWKTAAVAMLMAIWWVTEAIPIAAAAMIPLVLFPPLGISSIQGAAAPYANPIIFLFMGGFILALGMERWGLHRRIALSIIRTIGTRPQSIIIGFTVATALLSMWVSNTATAMMMLPIGLSIIELTGRATSVNDPTKTNFALVLVLGIAYSASIGGMATLVGTPTNALLAGFMEESYGFQISFADWFQIGIVLVLVGLPLMYLTLTRFVFPIRLKRIPGGKEFIENELASLGRMKRPEKMVAVVFSSVALFWIFNPLIGDYIPGLSDAGVAMTGALALFVLPVDVKRGLFVLDWPWAKRLPWGVLILFGGGLSLAAAVNDSGLAAWIGGHMSGLATWPVVFLVAAIALVVVFLTELTSNTATAAAFLPVVASVAIGIGQNPLLLVVPAVMAASCAFMLPVATPPNAIIYGSSFVTVPQMARAGLILNLAFTVLITLLTYTLLPLVFNVEFGILPDWVSPG